MADKQEPNCQQYVDSYNEFGYTELNLACWNGNFQQAELLLKQGADPNSLNGPGLYTPLHSSSWKGHLDIVKLLVDNKANVNAQNSFGFTPLNGSIWNGHRLVAAFLLLQNANITISNNDGFTPLHSAVWKGDLLMVKILIERRADVNSRHVNGYTPLHAAAAAKGGDLEIFKLLLENGAKVEDQDRWGRNAFQIAEQHGNFEIVMYLAQLFKE